MKLWDSFLEMVSDKNNLSDYKAYYSAVILHTKYKNEKSRTKPVKSVKSAKSGGI